MSTTSTEVLDDVTRNVIRAVDHYKRDLPFRAPESLPEHQARLLNHLWALLDEGSKR
jgi:hypothetical protein